MKIAKRKRSFRWWMAAAIERDVREWLERGFWHCGDKNCQHC